VIDITFRFVIIVCIGIVRSSNVLDSCEFDFYPSHSHIVTLGVLTLPSSIMWYQ